MGEHKDGPKQKTKRKVLYWFLWAILFFGVCFFSFFQLQNFPEPSPASDEGFYLRLATEKRHDLPSPLSLQKVTSVTPQFPLTMLYPTIVSLWMRVGGDTLGWLRGLSALMLVILAFEIGYGAYRLAGKKAAYASIVSLFFMPLLWRFGHMAIPHAMIAVLLFGSVIGLLEYRRTANRLWLFGGVFLALGALFVSYWALLYCLVLPFFLVPYKKWHEALTWLPIVVFGIYLFERYVRYGEVFVRDAHLLLSWQSAGGYGGRSNIITQIFNSFGHFVDFLVAFPIVPLALIGLTGLVLIEKKWIKWRIVALFGLLGLYFFRDRTVGESGYLALFLIPFLALGAGVVGARVYEKIAVNKKQFRYIILSFCTILALGILSVTYVSMGLRGNDQSAREFALDQVVRFAEDNTSSEAYIIASTDIYWRIRRKVADPTWVAVRDGINIGSNTKYPVEDSYFSYPTSPAFATLYIEPRQEIINFNATKYMQESVQGWPLVLENEYYRIFQNPAL